MALAAESGRHQVQPAVAHAALAHRVAGHRPHRLDRPAQDRDFQAGLVVEMDVQGRDLEIVVAVLGLGEAASEVARLVVVDVGERRDAEAVILARVLAVEALRRLFSSWACRL